MIQLGQSPNRIDILNSLSGVEFQQCYRNRKLEDIEGLLINFIGLECYKKNKKVTGRIQDLADLEKLESVEE